MRQRLRQLKVSTRVLVKLGVEKVFLSPSDTDMDSRVGGRMNYK